MRSKTQSRKTYILNYEQKEEKLTKHNTTPHFNIHQESQTPNVTLETVFTEIKKKLV